MKGILVQTNALLTAIGLRVKCSVPTHQSTDAPVNIVVLLQQRITLAVIATSAVQPCAILSTEKFIVQDLLTTMDVRRKVPAPILPFQLLGPIVQLFVMSN